MRELLALVVLTVAAAGFLLLTDMFEISTCLEAGKQWDTLRMTCVPDPGFTFQHNGRP